MPSRVVELSVRRQLLLVVWAVALVSVTVFTVAGLTLFDRYRPQTMAMEPTVERGDRIWTRPAGGLDRGDVVLLVPPPPPPGADSISVRSRPRLVITRIVAIGGDTVEATAGALRINGVGVEESYLARSMTTPDIPLTTVPEGDVYFLGDNRRNSVGSAYLGPVAASAVEERVTWVGAPSMGWVVAFTIVFASGFLMLWSSLLGPRSRGERPRLLETRAQHRMHSVREPRGNRVSG
jgi:signal peptidase I